MNKLLPAEQVQAILDKNDERKKTPREVMREFLREFINYQRKIGKIRIEVDQVRPGVFQWRFTFEEYRREST